MLTWDDLQSNAETEVKIRLSYHRIYKGLEHICDYEYYKDVIYPVMYLNKEPNW